MIRTAIRLATVATLMRGGVDPKTIAGERVYDSRRFDIDNIAAEDRYPAIIVRTADDAASFTFRDQPIMPDRPERAPRVITLRIEFGIVSGVPVMDEQGEEILVAAWPQTDGELEMMLDLLEFQIRGELFGTGDWATWWQNGRRGAIRELSSIPIFEGEDAGHVQLAAREMTLLMQAGAECYPSPSHEADPVNLEEYPHLTAVFDFIDAHGTGDLKQTAATMRALLNAWPRVQGGVYPGLERVRTTIKSDQQNRPSDFDAELLSDLPPADLPEP